MKEFLELIQSSFIADELRRQLLRLLESFLEAGELDHDERTQVLIAKDNAERMLEHESA